MEKYNKNFVFDDDILMRGVNQVIFSATLLKQFVYNL